MPRADCSQNDGIDGGDGDCIEGRITVRDADYECAFEVRVNCSTVYVTLAGLTQLIKLATEARKTYKKEFLK